jgi:hypothetical protein
MPRWRTGRTVVVMPVTFPGVWLLLLIPFASSGAIGHVRRLGKLTVERHVLTRSLGLLGLGLWAAGLLGVFPPALAMPAVLGGGLLSGFVLFGSGKPGDDDDDDDRRGPPEDNDPPPPPDDGQPVDWESFDRMRARWELPRTPITR